VDRVGAAFLRGDDGVAAFSDADVPVWVRRRRAPEHERAFGRVGVAGVLQVGVSVPVVDGTGGSANLDPGAVEVGIVDKALTQSLVLVDAELGLRPCDGAGLGGGHITGARAALQRARGGSALRRGAPLNGVGRRRACEDEHGASGGRSSQQRAATDSASVHDLSFRVRMSWDPFGSTRSALGEEAYPPDIALGPAMLAVLAVFAPLPGVIENRHRHRQGWRRDGGPWVTGIGRGLPDPFVALVDWLVQAPDGGGGSIEQLAKLSKVKVRTLRGWSAGSYPTDRNTMPVKSLHLWAEDHVRGYPPPDATGLTLIQLSGPERVSAGGRGGDGVTDGNSHAGAGGSDTEPTRGDTPAAHSGRGLVTRRRALTAAIVVAAVALSGVLTHWWGGESTSRGQRSGSIRTAGKADPSVGVTARANVPSGPTIPEVADNHSGSPVYRDARGASVAGMVPSRIPYGTVVQVRCQVPNQTGMSSVTALYLIASGRWKGFYGVADTFTNGDPLGSPGGHLVDKRVPACS
jgi:hypothetical protein